MVPGAMQTKRVGSVHWSYRWLPPAGEGPESGGQEGLPGQARVLLDKVERRWRVSGWDEKGGVPLRPVKEGEQGLEGVLLSGNICYEGAWYCPECEKALWLMERESPEPDWMRGETPEEEETPPPEPPPAPSPEPPRRRPKPRDDSWEEKGFFRRRKKPDWEK